MRSNAPTALDYCHATELTASASRPIGLTPHWSITRLPSHCAGQSETTYIGLGHEISRLDLEEVKIVSLAITHSRRWPNLLEISGRIAARHTSVIRWIINNQCFKFGGIKGFWSFNRSLTSMIAFPPKSAHFSGKSIHRIWKTVFEMNNETDFPCTVDRGLHTPPE